ncbi:hypothetical protein DAPPUDRAFT_239500 [Daphnia pulex]|uniref:Uncharacterized protein n=1 Tax=Daphnia pulex TaxID=6669 RepID=E9G9H7_DAPPU|nr:hypothetical protein DAPPUDRAFT_239500 [Daphnia pulex]|eukprot:EFX83565.1 hypothetical protein DAPPUDRAFT_239500 [Daphnia pulex]
MNASLRMHVAAFFRKLKIYAASKLLRLFSHFRECACEEIREYLSPPHPFSSRQQQHLGTSTSLNRVEVRAFHEHILGREGFGAKRRCESSVRLSARHVPSSMR